MSLRKAIVLLLLAAFSFGSVLPASAISSISETDPVLGIQSPSEAPTTRGIYPNGTCNTRTPANGFLAFNNGEIQYSNVTTPFVNGDTIIANADGSLVTGGVGTGVIANQRSIVLRLPAGFRWEPNRLNQGNVTAPFVNVAGNDQVQLNVSFLGAATNGTLPAANAVIVHKVTAAPNVPVFGNGGEVQTGDLLISFVPQNVGQPLNSNIFNLAVIGFDIVADPTAPSNLDTFITAALVDLATVPLNGGTANNALNPFTAFNVPIAIDRGTVGASELRTIVNSSFFNVDPADATTVIQNAATTKYNFGVDLNSAQNGAEQDIHIPQIVWGATRDLGSLAAGNNFGDRRNLSFGAYAASDPFLDSPIDVPGGVRLLNNVADSPAIAAISLSDGAVFTKQAAKANLKFRVVDFLGVDIPGATITMGPASMHVMSSDRANNLHGLLANGAGNIGQTVPVTIDPQLAPVIVNNESEHIGNLGSRIVGNPAGFADDEWGMVGLFQDAVGTYVIGDATNFDDPNGAGSQFTQEVGRVPGDAQFPRPLAPGVANVFQFNAVNADDRIAFFNAGDVPGLFTNELGGINAGTNAALNNSPFIDANNPANTRAANIAQAEVNLGVNGDTDSEFDIPGTMAMLPASGAPGFIVGCGAQDGSAQAVGGCGIADTTYNDANYGTQIIFPGSTGAAGDFTENVVLSGQVVDADNEICLVPSNTFGNMNQGIPTDGSTDGGAAVVLVRPTLMVENVPAGTSFRLVVEGTGNTLDPAAGQLILAEVIQQQEGEVNLNLQKYVGTATECFGLVRIIGTVFSDLLSVQGLELVDFATVGNGIINSIAELLPAGKAFDTELALLATGKKDPIGGGLNRDVMFIVEENEVNSFNQAMDEFNTSSILFVLPDELTVFGNATDIVKVFSSVSVTLGAPEVIKDENTGETSIRVTITNVPESIQVKDFVGIQIRHEYTRLTTSDKVVLAASSFPVQAFWTDLAATPTKIAFIGEILDCIEWVLTLLETTIIDGLTYISNILPAGVNAFDFSARQTAGAALNTAAPLAVGVDPISGGGFSAMIRMKEGGNSWIPDTSAAGAGALTFDQTLFGSSFSSDNPVYLTIPGGTNVDGSSQVNTFSPFEYAVNDPTNTGPLQVNDASALNGSGAVSLIPNTDGDNGDKTSLGDMTEVVAVVNFSSSSSAADVSANIRTNPFVALIDGVLQEFFGDYATSIFEVTSTGSQPNMNTRTAGGTAQELAFGAGVNDGETVIVDPFSPLDPQENLLGAQLGLLDCFVDVATRTLTIIKGVNSIDVTALILGLTSSPVAAEATTDDVPDTILNVTSLAGVLDPGLSIKLTNTTTAPFDSVNVIVGPDGSFNANLRANDGDRIVVSGPGGAVEFFAVDQAGQPQITSANVIPEQAVLEFPQRGKLLAILEITESLAGLSAIGFDPVAQAANFTIDEEFVNVINSTDGRTFIYARVSARNREHTLRISVQDSEGNTVNLSRTILGINKNNNNFRRRGGGFINARHRTISGDYRVNSPIGFPRAERITVLALTSEGELLSPAFERRRRINGSLFLTFTEAAVNNEDIVDIMMVAPKRVAATIGVVDVNR